MVYRGRPSASCFACRARRIKCDRLKPKCTQCSRMHVECPGYRDPLDQNFRDESESVVKRAQKSYKALDDSKGKKPPCQWAKDAAQSPYIKTHLVPMIDEAEYLPMDLLALVHWAQPIEDVAVASFMSSYVPGSHFEYLPFMYGQMASSTALHATVYATSMAALARSSGQLDLLPLARRSYVYALLETNAALANPLAAAEDATLVSVLLLGLFEAIAWSGSRTPDSWATHSRGALALIKLRGPQQLETEVGRHLFIQVANIVSVNSIRQKSRLPEELLDLLAFSIQQWADCPKYRLAWLTGEVSALRADIDEGGMTAEEIIDAAKRIDQRYIAYADGLTYLWRYQEIAVEGYHQGIYGNKIHQYTSRRAAGLWNSYRMTRILLNELIHAYSACTSTKVCEVLQQQAVDNIQQLTQDICASVPQFTIPYEFADMINSGFACSQVGSVTSSLTLVSPKPHAASVLFPLSVIHSASLANANVRSYATERLQHLGGESNIRRTEIYTTEDSETSALHGGLHMLLSFVMGSCYGGLPLIFVTPFMEGLREIG
ncbi:hypothetical protein CC86DRAFT_45169 [Ophiobolus disseminans]|uniref:Zn(2)-C6 fungal-type domain-containing protein n=1 Tax=Ophiobolus disseminans TaxID=1469910 RepID=A0A6A6ZU93_9PLEO|nr:hypothetical protein CC86DRAFT_45169 [Ophiobolus disseminans]